MATKAEVQSYLDDNYHFEDIGDELYKFVFEVDKGRTQLVFAKVFDAAMVLDSPFAKEDSISANLIFKLTEDVIFGVTRLADWYVLRHVVLLENVDSNEIDVAIRVLAGSADELESEIGGDQF